jgi:hypothetical protein
MNNYASHTAHRLTAVEASSESGPGVTRRWTSDNTTLTTCGSSSNSAAAKQQAVVSRGEGCCQLQCDSYNGHVGQWEPLIETTDIQVCITQVYIHIYIAVEVLRIVSDLEEKLCYTLILT